MACDLDHRAVEIGADWAFAATGASITAAAAVAWSTIDRGLRDLAMRCNVAKQGKGMIRAYGYTAINPVRSADGSEVANQPEMALDDRHHCSCNRA